MNRTFSSMYTRDPLEKKGNEGETERKEGNIKRGSEGIEEREKVEMKKEEKKENVN